MLCLSRFHATFECNLDNMWQLHAGRWTPDDLSSVSVCHHSWDTRQQPWHLQIEMRVLWWFRYLWLQYNLDLFVLIWILIWIWISLKMWVSGLYFNFVGSLVWGSNKETFQNPICGVTHATCYREHNLWATERGLFELRKPYSNCSILASYYSLDFLRYTISIIGSDL